MSYAKKAVKRTVIVFVISIIAALIAYIIRMVLARELEPAQYGLFFAVFTLFIIIISAVLVLISPG